MIYQRSLNTSIKASGIGLHSGARVSMTLSPAPVDTGIVFRRTDLNPVVEIPGLHTYVDSTVMCTKLKNGDAEVSTVEHLMSALSGLGINNCYVNLDGPEIPIMDGSAWPFVFLIRSAGIHQQTASRHYIRILKPIHVSEGDKTASFYPHEGFKLSFEIDFNHPTLNSLPQTAEVDLHTGCFVTEISRARTFGFVKDIEQLRSMNLALGGNMDNAIVIDDDGIANEDGLRSFDEFVKHKMLDAVGDLYLAGASIIGHFKAYKSGHALNHKLIAALYSNRDCWEWTYLQSCSNDQGDVFALAEMS